MAVADHHGDGHSWCAADPCPRLGINPLHIYTFLMPHSLGLLHSAFTYYNGFKVNSGEYKVIGLVPYGESKFAKLIKEYLVDIKEWNIRSRFVLLQLLHMVHNN